MSKKSSVFFVLLMTAFATGEVIPTNEWISIYGTNVQINGELIHVGTVVKAIDPDEVCCGEYIVEETGVIGLMPIYHDDPTTPDIDEGANPGDSITIFLNDYEIPTKIVWTFNGDIINISTIITSSSENLKVLPNIYKLCQNFPNPFNPVTTINYQIPEASNIELKIYNARGQEIKTLVSKYQQAGYYQVRWYGADSKGSQVSTGVYIYKIMAGNFSKTMKMLMIK